MDTLKKLISGVNRETETAEICEGTFRATFPVDEIDHVLHTYRTINRKKPPRNLDRRALAMQNAELIIANARKNYDRVLQKLTISYTDQEAFNVILKDFEENPIIHTSDSPTKI
jgi:hypothetical protein